MDPCATVRLTLLKERTEGSPDVLVGLVDGVVALAHPRILAIGTRAAACRCPDAQPCIHGTFVATMLMAARGTAAPAICPGCTLLVRPVFDDCATTGIAQPADVARAIHECVDAGARIVNVSSELTEPRMQAQPELVGALDRAAARSVLIVAAAGNSPTVASTAITAHPWVIPVAGYHRDGTPLRQSTFGRSIGSRGIGAPAEGIASLGPNGDVLTLDGTSFAAPFVTGTAALLWSLFPDAPAADVRRAILGPGRRNSVVPPLLDAERAYDTLAKGRENPYVRQAI